MQVALFCGFCVFGEECIMKVWQKILLAVLLSAALLAAVGWLISSYNKDRPQAGTPATALADYLSDPAALAEPDFALQQWLFWQYYNFTVTFDDRLVLHTDELRFLPDFAPGEEPDWEQTSRFLTSFSPYSRDDEGYLRWQRDDLIQTASVMLLQGDVPRQSSGWLEYIEHKDWYDAVGWDTSGAVYYLLTEPVTEENGVYTAKFNGYAVGELWADNDDFGKNFNDRKMYEMWQESGMEQGAFVRDVLPEKLAEGELACCEELTVTFSLSGDDWLPLEYASCERREFAGN